MSKFRETLKNEIKEEVGDLIYEKAKAEVKQKINDRFQSSLTGFLRFFGINRKQKESINTISEELKANEELFMSKTTLGILELFTLKFAEIAINISSSTLIENHHEGWIPTTIVERGSDLMKEKNQNIKSKKSSNADSSNEVQL